MSRRIIIGLSAIVGLSVLVFLLVFLPQPAIAYSAGEPAYVYWGGSPILNQGNTPECVGYALETLLLDKPNSYTQENIPSPYWIYTGAQARDEWRDTVHDGTSDTAAFQYLADFGYIDSVTYTHDPQEVADYVLNYGPVAIGSEWTYSMDYPDPTTNEITVVGDIRGYHEYILDEYHRVAQVFDAQNSWGIGFGNFGHFKISLATLGQLLQNNDAPENRDAALPHKDITTWFSTQLLSH